MSNTLALLFEHSAADPALANSDSAASTSLPPLLRVKVGVTARLSNTDAVEIIDILDAQALKLINQSAASHPPSSSMQSEPASDKAAELGLYFLDQYAHPIDTTICVLPAGSTLYQTIGLPFAESRKVEQIAKIELQDNLPFDLDQFVVQTIKTESSAKDSHTFLSCVAPNAVIEQTLEHCKQLGREPLVISTSASSISAFSGLIKPASGEAVAICGFCEGCFSVAIIKDAQILALKELETESLQQVTQQLPEILAFILSTKKRCQITISQTLVVGSSELVRRLGEANLNSQTSSNQAFGKIVQVDLNSVVKNLTHTPLKIEEIATLLGILVAQKTEENVAVFNLRTGKYAVTRTWAEFKELLADELLFIIAAPVMLVLWMASSWMLPTQELSNINSSINRITRSVISDSPVPKMRERESLEEKIGELESQLRQIGSLSELSPLDSLKLLSAAVTPEINIEIEAVNIGASRMLIRGSVPDNPTLGKLEGLLNKNRDRFCKVQVDPKGRAANSQRVSFSAEIKFCE